MAFEDGRIGHRILVVEDDAMVGMGLSTYLEELGATVTWSTTVPEALAGIARGEALDIAIVDLNLHGEVSTPVIDSLLARQVFTILCTGYDQSIIEDRFRHLPRAEKPFTRSMIRQLLASRAAA